ncbi:SPOSA6832_03714 [Sporobolomyces salmonicolor]|uniref:SPOSA6832_03714-mRNA-1:cds n=1 Tax=Sporidiobolus salmonicolor TaxID=5005 RepID=A0A0D6EPS0_SPOSA|nr:SPOSA6832_03714 [Sporobolomyces salmonicolor]
MKRMVLLCDGTLKDADSQQDTDLYTNIGRMSRALLEEDNRSNPPIDQIKGALGSGMMGKVRELYNFICLNWETGDELLLLGFSRGAYTIRLLASLISIIGVLHPRRSMQLFPALFEALDDRTGQDPKHDAKVARRVQKLLSQFSADKNQKDLAYSGKGKFLIKAIGVFDTVGTRGRPSRLRFNTDHDLIRFDSFGFDETRLEPIIELAFQALALEEHRIDYMPVIWKRDLQIQMQGQRLLQVWFEGAHAGSSSRLNFCARPKVQRTCTVNRCRRWLQGARSWHISLYWMIAQLHPYLAFDFGYLKKIVKPTTAPYGQMPPHKSRIGEFKMAKAVDRKVPTRLDLYVPPPSELSAFEANSSSPQRH